MGLTIAVMPKPETATIRPLTAGELQLAHAVFGGVLDTTRVTVRRAKYWALHPWWVTMAPNGHLWCHPNGFTWVPDFAAGSTGLQAHFVHELVHVWQFQTGGHLALRRPPFARYDYDVVPGRPFHRYGIEQQARMVEDAFRARAAGDVQTLARLAPILPFPGWQ